MSRIKKALVKAQSASQGAPKGARRKDNTFKNKVDPSLDRIAYTSTKVEDIRFVELEKKGVISHLSHDPRAQLFRTLRTQVIREMRDNGWKTLGITSPQQGEGKSLMASNLAVVLAMELNQSVLLVDMDLQNPTIHKQFMLNPDVGLKHYLMGQCELQDLLVNPGIDRLVICPGKGTLVKSSELLSGPKMDAFMEEAKHRYESRIILCDLPAVLPTDDVLAAINHLDCVLLVVEDGRNSESDLAHTLQILKNTHVLGAVLNKVPLTTAQPEYRVAN